MSSKIQKKTNYADYMYDIIVGAEYNNYNIVDAALEENPNSITDIHQPSGMTALHIAAGNGNADMVDHLLSKPGIDITIRDSFGRDALDMAISIGDKEIIEALSRRMYPKSYGNFDKDSGDNKIIITRKFDI